MYDDVAGLRFTLEEDGFDRFEIACSHEESSVRSFLLGKAGIEEALVLRTCQRYEIYLHGPDAKDVLKGLGQKIGVDVSHDSDRLLAGDAVVEHLLRVACGLESGVLGEDEILGQLRGAYKRASDADALGGTLDTIALKALRVGERARTETRINEGRVSLGSVTLDRAREELPKLDAVDELKAVTVLVVGAGEVAELVVKSLAHRISGDDTETDLESNVSLTVANRTLSNAEELAEVAGGDAIELDELADGHLSEADLVVTATGSDDRVLSIADLVGHELIVFDLANPRDVDPGVDDLEDVELVTIDEVLSVRNEELKRREASIPAVEGIIAEERARLAEQLRAEEVDDTLSQIYSRAHERREAEFERALDRLDAESEQLTAEQEAAMRDFSEALVNKLLHPKTTALRQAAATDDRKTVDAWLTLFDRTVDEIAVDDVRENMQSDSEESTSEADAETR
ncbi:glutamyl-tRNA reductase [Halalkaliarchaeum desulfuricum]|uniref:Glutamyl-tRNA reductase n=1 Tax=Halalkaliarchaeum desulfuricum TaxID=2055893 RepID=A0A343TNT5_9EURY|nr:glutamyl-tRNA reductase [Halalkaliarchaeum desulfuricum]AUX10757.1 glutamyl-tRNA reductase [Halalkaliarchaeum desulfuricum]